jgi:hypothetical protein
LIAFHRAPPTEAVQLSIMQSERFTINIGPRLAVKVLNVSGFVDF